MLTLETLDRVLEEMRRTARAAVAARELLVKAKNPEWVMTRETAALKRASLDLSFALADMRRKRNN